LKNKHLPIIGIAGMLALSSAGASDNSLPKKPNIIFILADDLGIGYVGCCGSDAYKKMTPNIDKLAKSGIRFSNAYTNPLCGPSRATILTGRYAFRTGATNQDATKLFKPSDETMIPSVLKQAGYTTSMVGKWGQLPLGPADFGFDDYLMFRGSGKYWNTQKGNGNYQVNSQRIPLKDGEYLPDKMHDHMISFIKNHQKDPFFIYYSMSHIHGQILPTPDSVTGKKDYYADNIAYMDKLVGKLTDELDRLHLRENTLIVFFGDNGTPQGRAETSTVGGRVLLGSKGTLFEGGTRVPMIVNWQGVTPENGKVSEELIDSSDFMPTFAELAGVNLPQNKVIDGVSFVSQLQGDKGKPREWIFVQLAAGWFALEKGWKLNQDGELFDLSDAPWTEKLVTSNTTDSNAVKSRIRLQAVLDRLNPQATTLDKKGDTGKHANKEKKKNKTGDGKSKKKNSENAKGKNKNKKADKVNADE